MCPLPCYGDLVKLAIYKIGKLGGGVVLVRDVPASEQELQFWLQLVWFRLHATHMLLDSIVGSCGKDGESVGMFLQHSAHCRAYALDEAALRHRHLRMELLCIKPG